MELQMTAPCLLGLEGLVAEELRQMDAREVTAENGRVFFNGDQAMLARANINSRFAERILIVLDRFTAVTFEELFQTVRRLPWSEFIGSTDTFPVKGYSISSTLHSVPDCQKIIKKAVVESLKEDYHISWFDETGPVHQIQFSILKDQVTIMLDTTGTGLHKRGYRPESNAAPIRETLAAALCSLSRLRHYHTLYDPFAAAARFLLKVPCWQPMWRRGSTVILPAIAGASCRRRPGSRSAPVPMRALRQTLISGRSGPIWTLTPLN